MALAVPGTVNTLQNGFSLAGSAPKTQQPFDPNAINMHFPPSGVTSQAVTPQKPFTGIGTTPPAQQAPINFNNMGMFSPAGTLPPGYKMPQVVPLKFAPDMASNPPSPVQQQSHVPGAAPVQAHNGGLVDPKALNPQSQPASFPSIVGNLAQTAQSGTAQGQQLTGQVAQTAQGNIPIGQQASQIASNYGQQIADVGQQAAMGEAGINTTGTSPVAFGNSAIVQQTAAARQQALAQGEQAALAGTGQQLTAQQQAQQGLASAGGLAQSQQQLTQSGLQAAGGLAQPSVAGYGQTSFNPLTQQYGTGGGAGGQPVGPNDPLFPAMQTYAQMLANGQGGAIPPSISGNPALQAQLLQMAQQGTGGAFNFNTAQGVGAAQQANAQLAVGGTPQANFQVYQQGLGQLYSVGQQLQNVTGLGDLTLQNATAGTVNPFDLRYANQSISQFRKQLSSTAQATFNSNLAAFQSAAGALLASAPGETPTDVTNKISSIADGSMSLDALKAMLDAAKSEGTIRYQSQLGVVEGAHQQLVNPGGGSTQAGGTTSGTSGVTPSGIKYTIE